MGCGLVDAGAALELAARAAGSRSPSGNAVRGSGSACTMEGEGSATWPTQANQTIRFVALRDRTVGDADFLVTATASSRLRVFFSAAGECTVHRSTVHITGAGACVIAASQPGNASYNLAREVSRTFVIAPRAAPTKR